MKIKNVAIKNFRGYSDEINSDFEDLTAFVGKNDIGKSTILEALDIRLAAALNAAYDLKHTVGKRIVVV